MSCALPVYALDAVLEHACVQGLLEALSQALRTAFEAAGLALEQRTTSTMVEPSRHTLIRWWQVPHHVAGQGELALELCARVEAHGALTVSVQMYGHAPGARESHGLLELTLGHVPGPLGWEPAQGARAVLEAFGHSELGRRTDWTGAAQVMANLAESTLAP